ncbi:MAG: carboxypeptidase-like regulatory domain-containing protein [Blastocatellia bacterium]
MRTTRKYLIAISAVFLLSVLSPEVSSQTSTGCVLLNENEKTRTGYFATIVLKEKKTLRSIHGVARVGFEGEPTEGVFIEVFEQKRTGVPRRVAGCRTAANGKFGFNGLPKGRYLLRLSKNGGFQITDIELSLDPRSKNTKETIAFLQVGH